MIRATPFFVTLTFAAIFAQAALAKDTFMQDIEADLTNADRQFLPTASDETGVNACRCLDQGHHCSPIIAALSETCAANMRGLMQPEECVVRCFTYCREEGASSGLCVHLKDWLEKKVNQYFRGFLNYAA